MNWKAFGAMLARDAQVARRNIIQIMFQTFLQPLLFVFIFGKVMVGSGYMRPEYKSLLLPGIIAISMVFTGIWAVAMPLIAEFQWTREIEDRLLAPIDISWIAIEKVVAGMLQALVSGLAGAAPRRRYPDSGSARICCNDVARSSVCRLRWTSARLLDESAAYRPDVQHGDYTDDLFRLHLLSVECAQRLPYSEVGCAREPVGLCQRGIARRTGTAVFSSIYHRDPRSTLLLRHSVSPGRPAAVRE